MCWYKIRLKKLLQWASWGVDLIFRIACQISGQDNVSCKIEKSYWHFQIKSFYEIRKRCISDVIINNNKQA